MDFLSDFFLTAADGTDFVHGTYDPGLVFLSLVVPIGMALMGLHTGQIARNTSSPWYRHVAIGISSIAFGCGIWAMHFIGMLAFRLPAPVHYNLVITGLSLLPGWAASWVAMYMLARRRISRRLLTFSGGMVGAGIGAMHYTGMAAMMTPLTMRYDPLIFALSIVVAVVLARLALWIRFGVRRTRLSPRAGFILSGIVMGVAIAGMHYTGMAAVRYLGEPRIYYDGVMIGHGFMALALACLTLTIGAMVAAVNAMMHSRELYRAIDESKSRLTAILDTAPDAIITIDGQGLIQDYNESATNLFGHTADETRGRNITMLMPEPYRSRHDEYMRKYRDTREPHVTGGSAEVLGLRKDGTSIPIRVAVGRVALPDDQLLFVGLIADVSERQALEASLREEARRAEEGAEAKTRFLANMSHEIRTPMNSVIGFTDLLLETDLSSTQRQYLNTIKRSSDALLNLINDILDTTKMEHGRVKLEHYDFSMQELARQVESSFGLSARNKGLSLTAHYPDSMPAYFKGDGMRLQQVLTNLVGNAIKFTESGRVDIRFSYQDKHVRIEIEDTGIGMSKEQLETIFDAFTQADSSISRRFGGTGLGTTIARQFVEAMGGEIAVDSTPGQGSTFHLSLPLPLGEKPAKADAPQGMTPLPPLHILIADDVDQNLELLRLTLENRGHATRSASDGMAAVEQFKSHEFDIILMDVHMPNMDGLQATREIRYLENSRQQTRTPIIALTASVMVSDQIEAQDAGMDGFAVKPLNLPRMFMEMARVLGLEQSWQPFDASSEHIEMPVVNWDHGISLWGNRRRLAEQVHRFLASLDDKYPLPIDDHAPDLQTLRNSLHGIRGAAGNLGLMALSHAAGTLEDRIRQEHIEHVGERLDEVFRSIEAVRQAITDDLPVEKTPAPTTRDVSADQLHAALSRMLEALSRNELDDDTLATVCAGLAGRGRQAAGQAIRDALDEFDFEGASDLVKAQLEDDDGTRST